MMRLLLLTLVIGLSSGAAMAANNNPAMRACRIDQGIFWILKGEAQEEYVMCFFDNAALGAEEFFEFKSNQGESLAIEVYKSGNYSGNNSDACDAAGADSVAGSKDNNQSVALCKFSDGSLIDANTLSKGPGSPETAKLDLALSSTY